MTSRRWIADSSTASTASLLGAQAEHLARVLRAQPGAAADVVVDGRVFHATIASVSSQEVTFHLLDEITAEPALPVTLLLSVFKFDRMEWAIEKATELGVSSIVPILARRTEKHLALAAEKRAERWRRIAHEAAKQSRRADIPDIGQPLTLASQLQLPSTTTNIVLAENEQQATLQHRIQSALATNTIEFPNFAFAIGPEGGWTNEELSLFNHHHWQPASLGPRILRAETAAIATLAIASALL